MEVGTTNRKALLKGIILDENVMKQGAAKRRAPRRDM